MDAREDGRKAIMRVFASGARSSDDTGKPDYEGFLSAPVLEEFGKYMAKHTICADGTARPSDDWQKGIPYGEHMKSAWRHFMDVWTAHRGWSELPEAAVDDALCALFFRVQGMLHERLMGRG